MTTAKQDFEGLLTHPGWLRLKAWAEKHWQDEITSRLRGALDDADDEKALQKMRQIIVAKDAVERLMRYPDEQIAAGTAGTFKSGETVTFGRGGYRP